MKDHNLSHSFIEFGNQICRLCEKENYLAKLSTMDYLNWCWETKNSEWKTEALGDMIEWYTKTTSNSNWNKI